MKVILPDLLPKFAVALGLTLLLGACAGTPRDEGTEASATAPQPAAASSIASNEGGEDEIICRNEQRTGTAFKTRTCMTREQWRITQRGQRRIVEEMARGNREAAAVGAAESQNSAPAPGGGAVPR